MPAVRYLVDDVDAALVFCRGLCFRLAECWGSAFAIVKKGGLAPGLSGPGSSARLQLGTGELPLPGAGTNPEGSGKASALSGGLDSKIGHAKPLYLLLRAIKPEQPLSTPPAAFMSMKAAT